MATFLMTLPANATLRLEETSRMGRGIVVETTGSRARLCQVLLGLKCSVRRSVRGTLLQIGEDSEEYRVEFHT